MKNAEIKNLRVAVVPTETGTGIDQSSSVAEILACKETVLYPITDYFQAQNDEEIDLLHWSFLLDFTNPNDVTDITGSNIDGIHQFDKEVLYTVKYWATEVDFNNGDAIDLRDDYSQEQAVDFAKVFSNLCYAHEIYETESGETFYHSKE